MPINYLDFCTIDKGPDSNQTGNKTFLRRPKITRRERFKLIFYPVAEMSSTFARSNNLPSYGLFQEPVNFTKNLNLLLVDKLQILNTRFIKSHGFRDYFTNFAGVINSFYFYDFFDYFFILLSCHIFELSCVVDRQVPSWMRI